jgi:error-prone DNA polymerase
MTAHGYEQDFAERCFKQIEGFGSYGFPESHAASFAKLVYASAWIKHHYPDAFCAAILNSQPMGFYAPAQLVRDAREHGVEVHAPDALLSDWDCTLEPTEKRLHAVRLGLRMVQGLSEVEAQKLIAARNAGAHRIEEIARKAGLAHSVLERIAGADAFRSTNIDRRQALWRVSGLADARSIDQEAPLLAGLSSDMHENVALPPMPLSEHVVEDYRTIHLSLKAHPCVFFRKRLSSKDVVRAMELHESHLASGRRVRVAGLVLNRQRPGTAKGVMFATLEDESGPANIIVWPNLFEAQRRILMTSSFLLVEGKLQKASGVVHVIAERVFDLTSDLARLCNDGRGEREGGAPRLQSSRDFH